MDIAAERCDSVQMYTHVLRKIETRYKNTTRTKRSLILFTLAVAKRHPSIAGNVLYICKLYLERHYPSQSRLVFVY